MGGGGGGCGGECGSASYNRPNLSLYASWNDDASTFADQTFIGQKPTGLFVNDQDVVYAANRENGQILLWNNTLSTPTRIISTNSTSPWSLFVTIDGDIYADHGSNNGHVNKWTFNATQSEIVMNVHGWCTGLFIDNNNHLYCSSMTNHRVVTTALNNGQSAPVVVAGTGCPGPVPNMLDHPHGIFVDDQFNLYVADTDNNRIELFAPGQKNAITLAGFGAMVYFILNRPTSIVLDGDGYLFIVESQNHRIIRSVPNGFKCLVGCSGSSGKTSKQLDYPQTMAFGHYWKHICERFQQS
ncbi:unnamed protein product [Rotaria sp. Silwood2]|nr:unnamed protein product [Rotaria sp. Silwood2]CAF3273174.1 unnamed protein product [Rotaria sp. Silwood2]CAF4210573.1 unnamed protein product [Rotaria sp. Silwood2]CAF4281923.1 unnamed protein product [Rotaria sp. Silwood2]CAF4314027.1 unnamed protein product [Rotaria sp. Silwood2]